MDVELPYLDGRPIGAVAEEWLRQALRLTGRGAEPIALHRVEAHGR